MDGATGKKLIVQLLANLLFPPDSYKNCCVCLLDNTGQWLKVAR